MIMFDSRTTLHKNNVRYKNAPLFYRQWELCQTTNPECITTPEEAFKDADVLVALSKPGPDTIKAEWIKLMAEKPIVFVCANPVPEIYPYQAKEAGAYIIATGRGDFPNQVNNSVCFPSILKGTLLVSARKITDSMAICAAHSIASFAEQRGIHTENIMPNMLEWELFPKVAADVAMQAIKEGVSLKNMTWQQVYEAAKCDIREVQDLTQLLQEKGYIKPIEERAILEVIQEVVKEISNPSHQNSPTT
jgi:malate dehydrogenase (oxaloacetate-decarboxylating)